jgi:methionyl aminopeptidase
MPARLTPADVDAAYASAQKVVEIHRRLSVFLRPGQKLAEIDAFVARSLEELKCTSCFLGYTTSTRLPKFPSYACLSVNDCVVHGTAGYTTAPLKPGDVLKIDIGVLHRGWIGDAAWTYLFAPVAPEVKRLADCGKDSLRIGIQHLQPGRPYIDWARAVQEHVEGKCGFHLVRGLGGHGYFRSELHAPPYVSNVVPLSPGEWSDAFTKCQPGTTIAVEPMIAAGTHETRNPARTWPIFSADGSLTVHHEHDVLITEKGPRVLTEGLDEINDVIS